jgi:hypothetical protein
MEGMFDLEALGIAFEHSLLTINPRTRVEVCVMRRRVEDQFQYQLYVFYPGFTEKKKN